MKFTEEKFAAHMRGINGSAIREIFKLLAKPGMISFAGGNPAPESFPVDKIAEISADIFKNNAAAALQYSTTEGYPKLRELVAERIKTKFSVGRDFDSTIITSGGQQGIELACKVLCNEGDTVIAEVRNVPHDIPAAAHTCHLSQWYVLSHRHTLYWNCATSL